MQTKAKANSTITHSVDEVGVITFNVLGAGSFSFDPFQCHEEIQNRAAMHGFIQRISDGGALGRDVDTGLPATPQAKFDRMHRIAAHMMSGTSDWNLRTAADGSPSGLTLTAMVDAGLAADAEGADNLVAKLAATRGIERKAALALFAKSDKVSEAIEAIRAKRKAAEPKVNVDDLMAELDEDGETDGETD